MAHALLYTPLIINVVYFWRFAFADCLQSQEQCCPGYVWNKHLKKCERCESGFSGLSCKLKCPPPSYGLDCQQICKCKRYQICNFRYGCISYDHGCEGGLYGPLCLDKCPYPSYGKGCQTICNCDIEACDHKKGCVAYRTETRDFYNHIFSNVSTADINMFPNKSDLDKFIHSNSIPELSTGSGEQIGKTDMENVSPGNNHLLIIIISINSFAIVIVCCIFGICVYCKRKFTFLKLFESNKDGNVYDRNRLHEKRIFFREIVHKSQDCDLEITNMGGNSLQRFTNDNDSGPLEQRRHLERDIYESEPDPYLVPETNLTEPEFHPYLTVV